MTLTRMVRLMRISIFVHEGSLAVSIIVLLASTGTADEGHVLIHHLHHRVTEDKNAAIQQLSFNHYSYYTLQ